MRRLLRSFAVSAPVVILLTVAIQSCTDGTGPQPIQGRLAVIPTFQSRHAGIVEIDRMRAIVFRLEESSPILDTVVSVTGDSVDVELVVTLTNATERFLLVLALITPAGDTAFRAGPDTVAPTVGLSQAEPLAIEIDYVGVGADAAGVQILTADTSLFSGEEITLLAEALDSADAPIPGTPIGWTSLDPNRASVSDEASGTVVAGAERGTARLVATLLTDQADTIAIPVQPIPDAIGVVQGGGQTGAAGLPLPIPLVVLVRAPDGMGVQGIVVRLSTLDGGSFAPDSAMTNAVGEIQTTWTLGPGAGTQTGTATTSGIATLQTTFTANATGGGGERVTWINAAGGDWSDPGNWSAGRVPTSADTAVIGLDGVFTITVNTDASVSSLELGGASGTQTLALSGAVLTVNGAFTITASGLLSMTNGTVNGSGALDVPGATIETGATNGLSVISLPITSSATTIMNLASGTLSLSGGGSLGGPIGGAGSLDLQSGNFLLINGLNATNGLLSISGATTTVASLSTVTVAVLTLTSGRLAGTGTVEVTGAFIWQGGTMTDAGVTRLLPPSIGSIADVNGLALAGGRVLENAGNLAWLGGTVQSGEGSLIDNVTGGVLLIQGTDCVLDASLGGAPPILRNADTVRFSAGSLRIEGDFLHLPNAVLEGFNGTLDLDATTSVTLDGDIRPGTSPGILQVIGDFPQGTASTITIEIDGTTPGTEYDQIVVSAGPNTTGTIALDGTLDVVTSFTPASTDVFMVISYDARGGTLAGVNGLDLGNGTFLDTVFAANRLDLTVLSPSMSFTGDPAGTLPSRPIQPDVVVEVLDGQGSLFTGFGGTVDMTIGTNPGGGTLSGNVSVAPAGGVATFTDLMIDNLGTGYTLIASAAGVTAAESPAFDIVPGIVWAADSLLDPLVSGILGAEPDGADRFQITPEGTIASGALRLVHPRWSPDRSRVTYSARADVGVENQLHVVDIVTGTIAHLTSVGDTSTFKPRYNATGQRLAFICGAGTETTTPQDVCVIPDAAGPVGSLDGIGDGVGKTFVTQSVPDLVGTGAFAWDPTNSDQLAFVRDRDVQGNTASTIYIASFDGTLVDSLGVLALPGQDTVRIVELDWSPDGTFLVFSGDNQNFNRRIYRIDRDGTNFLQLTSAAFGDDDVHPVVSPDNTQVLFLRHDFNAEGTTFEYFLVPSDGATAEVQISEEIDLFASVEEIVADWSPDGSQIVLVGTDGISLAVYVVPPTVTPATYIPIRDAGLVSGLGREDVQPSWRP